MKPDALINTIRQATLAEIRMWFEKLQKEDLVAYEAFIIIVEKNPPKRIIEQSSQG